MEEKIRIKCKICNAVLAVANKPKLQFSIIECPVCKTSQHFNDYVLLGAPAAAQTESTVRTPRQQQFGQPQWQQASGQQPRPAADETILPDFDLNPNGNRDAGTIVDDICDEPGRLVCTASGFSYTFPPRDGKYVLGRQSPKSHADIQVPCPPGKRTSRDHLVIEVRNTPGAGYKHIASLFKAQVNPTRIGNTPLEYGDRIVLNDGDVLHLPDVDLRFEQASSDQTAF